MKCKATTVIVAAKDLIPVASAQSQEIRKIQPGIFAGIDIGRTTVNSNVAAAFTLNTSYSNNRANRAHVTSLGFKFYF